MLTDEHINAAWREVTQESIHDSRERFARAIEAAATAPLLEHIAALEAKLAQQAPMECLYGDNGYACCEGGPCAADVYNNIHGIDAPTKKGGE